MQQMPGLKVLLHVNAGAVRRPRISVLRRGDRHEGQNEHEQNEQWQKTNAAQWRRLLRARRHAIGRGRAATAVGSPISADPGRTGLPRMGHFHRLWGCSRS